MIDVQAYTNGFYFLQYDQHVQKILIQK